jgi:predicted HNH restriction endonuclease
MALQTGYTTKHLHELFQQYLLVKFEGDQSEANVIVDTAEQVLPLTLNEHFGSGYTTIYDLQDENEIESLRKKIKAHPVLKNIDRREEPRYTEVLKWYRLFVKSLQKETAPVLVPGEEEFPTKVADNPEPPVAHNDADYAPDAEGLEHQYNLTKKERNPELRRKCIEYYKHLWGGRIHCICCGFDFGKAYGDIGEGYIEIHHVNPHHTFEGVHMVDPAHDLIPLCSNCHSMIHRVKGQGECMTLKELKEHYKGIKYND